jgi:hypothetical protein
MKEIYGNDLKLCESYYYNDGWDLIIFKEYEGEDYHPDWGDSHKFNKIVRYDLSNGKIRNYKLTYPFNKYVGMNFDDVKIFVGKREFLKEYRIIKREMLIAGVIK